MSIRLLDEKFVSQIASPEGNDSLSLHIRTFTAARWTAATTAARVGFQIAQIAVLSRFLSPQDFGLMAMVTVVLSYAALLSDMGLSTAYVQRQKVSHEERSSLFWLSVLVGGVLMLLVMMISPFAAIFFNEPRLLGLMVLASTNFLVVALGQQLRMMAEKELNFRPVALIEISASLVGFGVAVLMATFGWGVYSLVAAAMVTAWFTMLLSWLLLSNRWRPAFRLKWLEIRWFVRFGGGMVINNIINHINSTLDLLLVGRLLGATQLGLYSLPRNITLQIQYVVNPIFTRVGFPVIASIQNERMNVARVYLKIMNLTAFINAPIHVAFVAFAPEIVQLLMGDKFQDSVPLLRVLAAWCLLRSFGNPIGSLLFGLGRIKLSLYWNLCLLLVIPPALWMSARYGAIGMAWALVGIMGTAFIPGWAILVKPTCGATLHSYSRQVFVPSLCAAVAGGAAWLFVSLFTEQWIRLILGGVIGFVVYGALSWFFNRDAMILGLSFVKRRAA